MSPTTRPNRHAILVDAGYLLASSAQVLVGTSLRRAIAVSWERLVTGITSAVAESTDTELLRVLWYDATNTPSHRLMSEEHNLISLLPDVKLRLGRVNNEGAQKGVDTRIALDMVNLALQGAVSEIYLVSGDDDLTEAVDMAQDYGVRVSLFNVPNDEARIGVHATAMNLARVVDDRLRIPLETLQGAIGPVPRPVPRPAVAAAPTPAAGTSEPTTVGAGVAAGTVSDARTAAPETPEVAVEATPPPLRIPTPAEVARVHNGTPTYEPPAASIAYTSVSGSPNRTGPYDPDADLRAEIPDVVRTVVRNWLDSATQTDVASLVATKPTIPGDVDSTLLTDLVARADDRHRVLETETRWQLREAFWAELDRHV
ncbi:uncharacterized LabA/DUF88 family protein [Mumia flava]|uniref:Uncharacterized LabA/DUF88 family protein n=1 Tax=Mumia flava TaxID=1348852 RepID=A0A0B2BPD2_9ACTN|nr:NYN domain-containing protein [Mumia flava]PJJ53665.1 uncharacterized LabA/DUF88 family protein [Mumia flava]